MFKKNKDIITIIKEKKFSKELTAGYDPLEVDIFLDNVMRYVNNLENETKILRDKLLEKEEQIKKIKNEYDNLNSLYKLSKSELNKLIEDGYNNQKVIKDISFMRDEIEALKLDKRK